MAEASWVVDGLHLEVKARITSGELLSGIEGADLEGPNFAGESGRSSGPLFLRARAIAAAMRSVNFPAAVCQAMNGNITSR